MTPSRTERWVLPNGLVVLYQRDAAMPVTTGTLLLRTGSRFESDADAGLCHLTISLLLGGTRRRSAKSLADAIESLGGTLATQSLEDYAELGWLVPAADAAVAFDVLTEMLQEPAWPTDEVEKERAQVLADLRSRGDAIFHVAYDALRQKLFGRHAYARPVEGREASVRGFARKDLERWHRRFVRPDRAILAFAGPWPRSDARRLAERAFAGWKNPAAPGVEAAIPAAPAAASLERRPAAPRDEVSEVKARFQQAYVMVGCPAPKLGDKRVLPLKLWNLILGGGMSSRLFVELREKLGLAYEVSSFFPVRLEPSLWAAYLGLPAGRMPEAETQLRRVLDALYRRSPSAAELEQARRQTKSSYLMDNQTRRRQIWYAAWWEFVGRPPDYERQYLRQIDDVSLADVHRAGRQLLEQTRQWIKVLPFKPVAAKIS